MMSQGKSKIDRFYPTACFELFSAPTSSYLVTVLQIFGSVVYFVTYELLEKYGYIHRGSSLRFSVYITAISYALGGITAVTGILTKRRNLVLYNIWIMQALMFITDIVAVSIILIMAIGNRWELTYTLPRQFVNEQKFYGILGPFWMYLGAISLHITVAINMCFLQVFNTYLKFLDSKPSVESSQPLKLNNNNNNNNIRS